MKVVMMRFEVPLPDDARPGDVVVIRLAEDDTYETAYLTRDFVTDKMPDMRRIVYTPRAPNPARKD